MEKDPIFAEAERLYMLENPGGCLAAEDETVKRYWKQVVCLEAVPQGGKGIHGEGDSLDRS